jgi:hypothetical protein
MRVGWRGKLLETGIKEAEDFCDGSEGDDLIRK